MDGPDWIEKGLEEKGLENNAPVLILVVVILVGIVDVVRHRVFGLRDDVGKFTIDQAKGARALHRGYVYTAWVYTEIQPAMACIRCLIWNF